MQQTGYVNGAGELLAEDLRDVHRSLSVITGEVGADELLGEIFRPFVSENRHAWLKRPQVRHRLLMMLLRIVCFSFCTGQNC